MTPQQQKRLDKTDEALGSLKGADLETLESELVKLKRERGKARLRHAIRSKMRYLKRLERAKTRKRV